MALVIYRYLKSRYEKTKTRSYDKIKIIMNGGKKKIKNRRDIRPEEKAAVIELIRGEKLLSEVANSCGIVPITPENRRNEFMENASHHSNILNYKKHIK